MSPDRSTSNQIDRIVINKRHVSSVRMRAAETVLDFERPPQQNQWYDEEFRWAAIVKNATFKKTLQ